MKTSLPRWALLMLLAIAGCGKSEKPVMPSQPGPQPPKVTEQPSPKTDVKPPEPEIFKSQPHLETWMGEQGYKSAAPNMANGKKIKMQGKPAIPRDDDGKQRFDGKKLQLSEAKLYFGDERPVSVESLFADAAAGKPFPPTVVVEGVVLKLEPSRNGILLGGNP